MMKASSHMTKLNPHEKDSIKLYESWLTDKESLSLKQLLQIKGILDKLPNTAHLTDLGVPLLPSTQIQRDIVKNKRSEYGLINDSYEPTLRYHWLLWLIHQCVLVARVYDKRDKRLWQEKWIERQQRST